MSFGLRKLSWNLDKSLMVMKKKRTQGTGTPSLTLEIKICPRELANHERVVFGYFVQEEKSLTEKDSLMANLMLEEDRC